MTFGERFIVSANSSISEDDLDHEYGHLPQAHAFGPAFLPVYVLGGAVDVPLIIVASQTVGRIQGTRVLNPFDVRDLHDAHPLEWAADFNRPHHPTNYLG